MIIVKILLIFLLVILGLILLVLIFPVGGDFSFIDGKVKFKVRLWRINVMDSENGGIIGWLKKRKKKKKSKDKTEDYYNNEISDISEDEVFAPDETEIPAGSSSLPEDSTKTFGEILTDDEEIEDNSANLINEEVSDNEKKNKKLKKDGTDEEKSDITDKIDFILSTIDTAWSPLKRIFKGFRFSKLYIDFIIANEDAYKCAVNYGRFCGVVYNGIALMSRIFTVRLKTVDIQPGFSLKKSRWDASFSLDFRAGTVVIAGLAFLITFIFKVFLPNKFKKRKLKKSAAAQK